MRVVLLRTRTAAALAVLVGAAAWFAHSLQVQAHQGVGYNLRALHVAHDAEGATVYLRLTLPLIVAGKLGAVQADGSFEPAPYTYNRVESARVFHYLDFDALRRDGAALGRMVAESHELRAGGNALTPTLLGVRVHVKGQVPPFDTLDDAQAALRGSLVPADQREIDSGYVLVDTALRYEHPGGFANYSVRSSLTPGELGEPLTRNIVWDHRGGQTDIFQSTGLLEQAWTIDAAGPAVVDAK